jgi:L-fucose isomerase-like protein
MRKLTAEERAAKKAGQVAEVAVEVVAEEPKKKAKKAEKAEPTGIGADSFVMPAKSVEPEAPVAEEKDEKVAESASASEEDSSK